MVRRLKKMVIFPTTHLDNTHKTAAWQEARASLLPRFGWEIGKGENVEASWPPKKPGSYFRTLQRLLNLLTRWGGKEVQKGQRLDLGFSRLGKPNLKWYAPQ